MTLYDARMPDTDPQTHALIIGVGSYPHLPGGKGLPAARTFSLQQLTSPVRSAISIADWLLGHHNNPAAQLGSVELLLSPTEYTPDANATKRLNIAANTTITTPIAELSHIKSAFERWFLHLHSNPENIGLFYFCGHGLEAADRYLLPADYGAGFLDPFDRLINFTETYNNLTRCQAKTQCFFLDACRDSPQELVKAAANGRVGVSLLGQIAFNPNLRNAPIFHAAAAGQPAAGPPDKASYFSHALRQCLSGMGARQPTGTYCPVDFISLASALGELIPRIAEEVGINLSCDIDARANLPNIANLHIAQGPVDVLTTIACQPTAAHNQVKLTINDSLGKVYARNVISISPWKLQLRAGKCTIQGTFNSQYSDFNVEDIANPPLFRPHIHVTALPPTGSKP